MEYSNELKRLGERFPNKNIGSGNPSAKILVVVQKDGNEDVDFKYLKRLFRDFPSPPKSKNLDVLLYCYYVVYDEELLKDPFFERFVSKLFSTYSLMAIIYRNMTRPSCLE